jgi:CHAD domain-containing protein
MNSTEPEDPLPTEPRIREVLVTSLADRWNGFANAVAKSEKRPGLNNIHDMRVAARRLVAILDILETLVPDLSVADLRRSLRRQIREFGSLRDTQVHIVKARSLARKFPAFHIGLTVLKVRESAQLKEARKFFRTLDMPALEKMISVARDASEEYFSEL